MAETVKKLTVSYGAFSCTLEGFDDPFPVMKMVVDYFQSLADRDPSFGAHPERPDADYLRKLAQRGTNHEVEVETQENGVILRQTFDQMPETAPEFTEPLSPARGATLSLVPRNESAAPSIVAAADLADEMYETMEHAGGETELAASVSFAYPDQPAAMASPTAATAAADDYDREERALERLLTAARLRSGTEETLAPGNPMLRIKDSLQEQMELSRFADSAPSEAMPDADFVAEFLEPEQVGPAGAASTEDEPAKIEMIGFGTVPVKEAEENAPVTSSEPAVIDDMPEEDPAPIEVEADDAGSTEAAMAGDVSSQAAAATGDAEMHEADLAARFDNAAPHETPQPAEMAADQTEPDAAAEPQGMEVIADTPLAMEAAADLPENPDERATADASPDIADTWAEPVNSAEMVAESEFDSTLESDNPGEFDWHAAEESTEPVAMAAPAPMPLLVLGPALMVVSGDEAILDSEPEQPKPATELRRQIVRARPEATDFDYDAETRRSEPEPAVREPALSEDIDPAGDADEHALTLDNFARKVGAASLPELLEASAAYVTIVSGQPRFSRASILNMVDELSDERSYTQEARIKSFGKLLRNGSILRVEDGKFAISHSAKFNYEVKISA